ncbi:ATP-binding cassette domain-containing protein [Erysipelothrix sp. D19-032]
MIQFINVNKRYEHREVLEDINIRIEDGTILGLIGRNGLGKSTFYDSFFGVVEADAGIVAFNQQQVFDNPNVQKEVFFVSDDAYFMTKATIKEMRDFYKVFYKNFDDGRFYELLYLFDLDEDQSLNSFSKGMKRQVSLLLGIAKTHQSSAFGRSI